MENSERIARAGPGGMEAGKGTLLASLPREWCVWLGQDAWQAWVSLEVQTSVASVYFCKRAAMRSSNALADLPVRLVRIGLSAFNTIIPDILIPKLANLGLPPSTCSWIKDFLINRPQHVKLGPHLSSARTLSTGSPQGCVLSPLLYSLYTHDCRPTHPANIIVKFADDTTVVGMITEGNEAAYRDEVLRLSEWCAVNNLA
ncbi:hypothetical protein ACEWY4_022748 [Coilia grayii]|uniref:Reverse transcriptase domain-containing protein n=1 Tax=Coilia grayii TaxID=363190 RepID=A0ABD1J3P8_9TELE